VFLSAVEMAINALTMDNVCHHVGMEEFLQGKAALVATSFTTLAEIAVNAHLALLIIISQEDVILHVVHSLITVQQIMVVHAQKDLYS
jgi:hypothetical protein